MTFTICLAASTTSEVSRGRRFNLLVEWTNTRVVFLCFLFFMLVFHTSDSFETVRNDLFSVKRFFDWDTASLRYAIGLPRRRNQTTQNTSKGGEQRCVRKQLWASCPKQRIWRAACSRRSWRLVIFGVLQMSFSGCWNFEANSINVGFVNIPSNIKHLREDKLSFHSFCTSFFLYNGTSSTPCVRSRSKPRGQSWASANFCRRLSAGYHPFHCLAVCFNLARCAWKIFSVIRQVVNATKIVRRQKHLAAHQGTVCQGLNSPLPESTNKSRPSSSVPRLMGGGMWAWGWDCALCVQFSEVFLYVLT